MSDRPSIANVLRVALAGPAGVISDDTGSSGKGGDRRELALRTGISGSVGAFTGSVSGAALGAAIAKLHGHDVADGAILGGGLGSMAGYGVGNTAGYLSGVKRACYDFATTHNTST